MDIFLAIAIVFVTALIGYVGVHVTLHPAETPKAKRNYKIIFGALTLVACGLVLWQGILNRHEQNELHSQLNKIQKNTEQPPTVNVNVPPSPPPSKQRAIMTLAFTSPDDGIKIIHDPQYPQAGWLVNVSCKNVGTVLARRVACAEYAKRIPAKGGIPTNETLQEYWKEYSTTLAASQFPQFVDLDPGRNAWGSVGLQMLEVDPELNSGSKVIMVAVTMFYSDDAGPHKKEYCLWAQPPFNPSNPTWHFCEIDHNHQVY